MSISTIEAVLRLMQEARAMLDNWGVSTANLIGIGFLALLCFVVSLREVLGWYLKTHDLRDELRATRAQIEELQKQVQGLHERFGKEDVAAPLEATGSEPATAHEARPVSPRFQVDHWRNSL